MAYLLFSDLLNQCNFQTTGILLNIFYSDELEHVMHTSLCVNGILYLTFILYTQYCTISCVVHTYSKQRAQYKYRQKGLYRDSRERVICRLVRYGKTDGFYAKQTFLLYGTNVLVHSVEIVRTVKTPQKMPQFSEGFKCSGWKFQNLDLYHCETAMSASLESSPLWTRKNINQNVNSEVLYKRAKTTISAGNCQLSPKVYCSMFIMQQSKV